MFPLDSATSSSYNRSATMERERTTCTLPKISDSGYSSTQRPINMMHLFNSSGNIFSAGATGDESGCGSGPIPTASLPSTGRHYTLVHANSLNGGGAMFSTGSNGHVSGGSILPSVGASIVDAPLPSLPPGVGSILAPLPPPIPPTAPQTNSGFIEKKSNLVIAADTDLKLSTTTSFLPSTNDNCTSTPMPLSLKPTAAAAQMYSIDYDRATSPQELALLTYLVSEQKMTAHADLVKTTHDKETDSELVRPLAINRPLHSMPTTHDLICSSSTGDAESRQNMTADEIIAVGEDLGEGFRAHASSLRDFQEMDQLSPSGNRDSQAHGNANSHHSHHSHSHSHSNSHSHSHSHHSHSHHHSQKSGQRANVNRSRSGEQHSSRCANGIRNKDSSPRTNQDNQFIESKSKSHNCKKGTIVNAQPAVDEKTETEMRELNSKCCRSQNSHDPPRGRSQGPRYPFTDDPIYTDETDESIRSLQHLSSVNQLVLREPITGMGCCDTECDSYELMDIERRELVFSSCESHASCLSRQLKEFFCLTRPFSLTLLDPTGAPVLLLEHSRMCRWPCMGCSSACVTVKMCPSGVTLGSVSQRSACCDIVFDICNALGETQLIAKSTSQGSMYLLSPAGERMGHIIRVYTHILSSVYNPVKDRQEAAKYQVIFESRHLNPIAKALTLCAVILVDYIKGNSTAFHD